MLKTLALVVPISLILSGPPDDVVQSQSRSASERISIESQSWQLVGDLRIPPSSSPVPIVLLLNQAAGSRAPYERLAGQLAAQGIASLCLDLRGHGESTNLGRFEPGRSPRDPLIWDAERDVVATRQYLRRLKDVDASRVGIVGASYSGEEAAEAGRLNGHVSLYVFLSPGSLSEASIASLAESHVPWLFVTSDDDPFLRDVTATVRETAPSTEIFAVPGKAHATDLLEDETLTTRIAEWIGRRLN